MLRFGCFASDAKLRFASVMNFEICVFTAPVLSLSYLTNYYENLHDRQGCKRVVVFDARTWRFFGILSVHEFFFKP